MERETQKERQTEEDSACRRVEGSVLSNSSITWHCLRPMLRTYAYRRTEDKAAQGEDGPRLQQQRSPPTEVGERWLVQPDCETGIYWRQRPYKCRLSFVLMTCPVTVIHPVFQSTDRNGTGNPTTSGLYLRPPAVMSAHHGLLPGTTQLPLVTRPIPCLCNL